MRRRAAAVVALLLVWTAGAAVPPAAEAANPPPTPPNVVLSDADAERYRRIFDLQKHGLWGRADGEIARLEDRILLGHVLFQRYMHPTRYRSRYDELSAWLAAYSDHPGARRVWRLALRRKPRSARAPKRPAAVAKTAAQDAGGQRNPGYRSPKRRSAGQRREARRLVRSIRVHAQQGRIAQARRVFERKRTRALLDRVELDIARSRIGEAYFFRGTAKQAYAYSGTAAKRSGGHVPMAHWIAGLAAYRLGKHAAAADHFQSLAETGGVSPWIGSAAAFWAARANLVARRPDRVTPWLTRAGSHPRTFYGLLANRILGVDPNFDWSVPHLTAEAVEAIERRGRGRRALALLQVGEGLRAERELIPLAAIDDDALDRALFALSDAAGLPALGLRVSQAPDGAGEAPRHAAQYPLPRWRPLDGFAVDRAILYAFMRQESRFKARAVSRSGARGLMQLMPSTANFISKRRFGGARRALLYDPGLNLSLGQKYLRYLIGHETVGGDMLLLAAAYNGGPGNLAKWRKRADRHAYLDPLTFIESIPSRETRNFIERVLANLWIYRRRLGQGAPSLDALAAGEAPYYKALDATPPRAAMNHVRH